MHPTQVVERFIKQMAAALPRPQSSILRRLTTPQVASLILDHLVKDDGQRRTFGAMLSNTASPTVVRGGAKVNVIPGRASVEIDGRTLPGQSVDAFLAELRDALGPDGRDARLEVLRTFPSTETTPDTPLYEHLARTLRRHDPQGIPVPFLVSGFTDASAFAKLGTRCYGFAPVRFDPAHDVNFAAMYHGDDERIPVDGVHWGLRVLFDAVRDFA
jgi:acetylornithine deacetylase/succinyl-diaminopimelate desuccinylase-like protein